MGEPGHGDPPRREPGADRTLILEPAEPTEPRAAALARGRLKQKRQTPPVPDQEPDPVNDPAASRSQSASPRLLESGRRNEG